MGFLEIEVVLFFVRGNSHTSPACRQKGFVHSPAVISPGGQIVPQMEFNSGSRFAHLLDVVLRIYRVRQNFDQIGDGEVSFLIRLVPPKESRRSRDRRNGFVLFEEFYVCHNEPLLIDRSSWRGQKT
jgi:hypothetical protein